MRAVYRSPNPCLQLIIVRHCSSSAKLKQQQKSSRAGQSTVENVDLKTKVDKRNLVKHEYEIWRRVDNRMPPELSSQQFEVLVGLERAVDRLRTLTAMGDKQRISITDQAVKRMRYDQFRERTEAMSTTEPRDYYGMGGNFVLQRICKHMYHRWTDARYACMYPTTALRIVYDMSVLDQACTFDQMNTVKDLSRAYRLNMMHRQPSRIIFTGVNRRSQWFERYADRTFLPDGIDGCAAELHERHLIDLFPIDQLVYLSPDASAMLAHVDTDKVHVIGGMNDTRQPLGNVTLAEAKKRNIPCFKLPIDKYVQWSRGRKALPLSVTHGVLLDYVLTNDWTEALRRNVREYHFEPHNATTPEERVHRSELRYFQQQREQYLTALVHQEGHHDHF